MGISGHFLTRRAAGACCLNVQWPLEGASGWQCGPEKLEKSPAHRGLPSTGGFHAEYKAGMSGQGPAIMDLLLSVDCSPLWAYCDHESQATRYIKIRKAACCPFPVTYSISLP